MMTNSTENRQFLTLMGIGAVTILTNVFALVIAPYLFIDDTTAIARYLLLKVPAMLIDAFILIGSLVILDYLTPEDSLVTINQNPMSTAILYASMIIGLSIAIAFG